MRVCASICGAVAALACATPTLAQVVIQETWRVAPEPPRGVADLLVQLDQEPRFDPDTDEIARFDRLAAHDRGFGAVAAGDSRELRFEGAGFSDRLQLQSRGRLRRADGGPLPPAPFEAAAFDADRIDVTYTRGWTEKLGETGNGLDVTLSPHLGVGVGSMGGRTRAGATLKIGRDIDQLAPSGQEAFGDRPRWYVYAAGSGTAVGYNFARNRDGDFARSGLSRDEGVFLGDASIGVAMRRGAVHSSFGVVYREVEVEGLRVGQGVDTDLSEGLLAFQLSIKPE